MLINVTKNIRNGSGLGGKGTIIAEPRLEIKRLRNTSFQEHRKVDRSKFDHIFISYFFASKTGELVTSSGKRNSVPSFKITLNNRNSVVLEMEHEDEFLNTFFTHLSHLCFDKAKENVVRN